MRMCAGEEVLRLRGALLIMEEASMPPAPADLPPAARVTMKVAAVGPRVVNGLRAGGPPLHCVPDAKRARASCLGDSKASAKEEP